MDNTDSGANGDRFGGRLDSNFGSRFGKAAQVLAALAILMAIVALIRHFRADAPSNYEWDFMAMWKYRSLLLSGLMYTLGFTVICIVLGLLIGLIAGLGRLSGNPLISAPLRAYVELFRCTPVLVQLVWFYYALPILTGIELSAVAAATLCLALYGGAFYSEIIRGGIISVDVGQVEAAKAIGMRPHQIMQRIVLPQAFKKMVPPLMNQSIMQLKNTSLLSVLAVPDLLYQGQVIAHEIYRPLETYTFVAVAYFVVLLPVTIWAKRLEFAHHDAEV